MPFNFESIRKIYSDSKYAQSLEDDLIDEFGKDSIVAVTDLLNSRKESIRNYGQYMYEHEYRQMLDH